MSDSGSPTDSGLSGQPGDVPATHLPPEASPELGDASGEQTVPDAPPHPAEVAVTACADAARERHYEVEVLGAHAVRVTGRFGEPTLAALKLLLDAGPPIGVYAEGGGGGRSAMCLWDGQDLYAVTLGVGGTWEHFKVPPGGPSAIRDSWRGGNRPRFRLPRGPLFTPLPEAVALAESWGLPAPVTTPPAPAAAPPGARAASSATRGERAAAGSRPAARRAPRSAAAPPSRTRAAQEEQLTFCPTCFMALPATGVCDYCS